MKGKRLLAVLLAALMTASSVSMTTFAEDGAENTEQSTIENAQAPALAGTIENVEEGEDTQTVQTEGNNGVVLLSANNSEEQNTIEISTADDFKDFIAGINTTNNAYLDKNIILKNDIDLQNAELTQPTGVFRGTFDGRNYTVKNLKMSKPLFCGHIGTQGVVKNFTLENAELNNTTKDARLGLICQNLHGTMENVSIKNCKINSTTETGVVGALAAMTQEGGIAKSCTVDGFTVSIDSGATAIGGAFGLLMGDNNTVVENIETKNIDISTTDNTPVASLFGADNGTAEAENCTTDNELSVAKCGQFSYATLKAAIENAEDGDIVTLNADVVLDECITIESDITLDFNGKKVTTSEDMTTAFRIHADVTVKNGNMDTADYENYCFIVGYYDKKAENPNETKKTGSLVIENGTYKGDCTVAQVSCGTLTIEGGEYSVKPYDGEYKYLLNCIDAMYKAGEAKIYVKGGSFENYDPTNNAAEGTGTNFIAPGYTATANGSSYSVAKATSGVVKAVVGGEDFYYATLQQAIDNADDNSTITLCEDITASKSDFAFSQSPGNKQDFYTLARVANKKITLDLNGKTISIAEGTIFSDTTPDNWVTIVRLFRLNQNADLTITGNGAALANTSNADTLACAYAFSLRNNSTAEHTNLIIENGKIEGYGEVIYCTGANNSIVIKGGTFKNYRGNGEEYILNGNSTCKGKCFTVQGGTFVGTDPRFMNDGNLVAENYVVTRIGNEYTVIPDENIVATVTTESGRVYSYTTFADAIENAVDGDVITLKTNASGDGITIESNTFADKGLTIDLGGYTYTVDGKAVGSSNTKTQGFQFLKNNKIKIKNGTLTTAEIVKCHNKDDGDYDAAAAMLIQNYANLTLEGVTLDGSKLRNTGYTLSNNNGNVEINNSIITANGGYAFDVCNDKNYDGVTVTVSANSVIDGYVEISNNTAESTRALLKIGEYSYTENGIYYKVGGEFVKTEKRSINISADTDAVEMNDTVTVTVTLNGTNIANAVYDLTYDTEKFEFVSASTGTTATNGTFSEEMFYKEDGTYFTSGDVLATYTFKALGQTENVTADFVIDNVAAATYNEAYHETIIKTESNEKVSVAINLKDYALLLQVDDETVSEKATVPYTNEGHTFTVTAAPGTTVTYTVTYTVNNGDTLNSVELTEKGTYEIAYTVKAMTGYAEYTGTFTLTIGDPEYVVEVNLTTESNSDYVANKKIVLVYTDTDGLAFKYGKDLMIDVTSREYKYNGTDEYDHVYAFVTDTIDGATSVDAYKAKITCVIPAPEELEKLTYSMDINFSGTVNINDITTVYGIYNVVDEDFFKAADEQKKILRADTNGDKVVNGEDTNAVVTAVKNK